MLISKDINNYTHNYLHKIVTLIIKYAAERDVEILLSNVIKDTKLEVDILLRGIFDQDISAKENLVNFLVYDIWEDPVPKHIPAILRQTLVTHLNSIGACYYNYNFLDQIDVNEPKSELPIIETTTEKPISGMTNFQIDLNEVFNAEKLKNYEISQILHEIINNYTKNHFYYVITDNFIYKIEIQLKRNTRIEDCVVNRITEYTLINRDRCPCIIDKETGLEIPINRQIKTLFKLKGKRVTLCVNTYESFMGANERVIKALTFKPTPCHWCAPNKNLKNEKIKCKNCRNLLDELNHFIKKCNDDELKKTDFNSYVSSIGYNKAKNLADLRNRRKKLLYSFLNKAKKYTKNQEAINNLKCLIGKSFDLTIKY